MSGRNPSNMMVNENYMQIENTSTFKLDEGYSDDVHGEVGSNTAPVTSRSFEEWVMAQNEVARREIAFEILRTLRTSNIASVVSRLAPLLHYDPVQRLPAEITSEIFACLDAHSLLTASLASKAWRERILDSQLWKQLYAGQGWRFDPATIQKYEHRLSDLEGRKSTVPGFFRVRERDSGIDLTVPKHKKRAVSGWLDDRQKGIFMSPRPMEEDSFQWREQHGQVEADTDSAVDEPVDQEMHDVSSPLKPEYQPSSSKSNKRSSQDASLIGLDGSSLTPPHRRSSPRSMQQPNLELIPALKPSLTLMSPSGQAKMSWLYLYKQRRRLEDNWNAGRYVNYQLPQYGYRQEGHVECVYTLQFFGKWLVTGSRDQTMRIWDLETRRLRGSPLRGHSQSVLCLQFDPTTGEDVIISGSSDTTVMIWRFSTGQPIQTLQAHRESVLNLRFDHRYLITCSKDKLIKVWNRREMNALDENYPRVNAASEAKIPSYIIDTSIFSNIVLESKIANKSVRTLQPYSLLMALDGHSAAVNALQIEGDKIVSASGDRHIKIWDIRDGRILQTLIGHVKGIACVQFDDKRIISGSSDNSIRIYDNQTGAEVACLRGHSNLVRTLQAGFGDMPGSEDELRLQAEAADREWRDAVIRGDIAPEDLRSHRRSRAMRHATQQGPRNYRDISAIGAALPPGGGGSKWGRIVSGSYDESIIIWKKDAGGRWVVSTRLSHASAAHAATAVSVNEWNAEMRTEMSTTSSARSGSGESRSAIAATSGPSSAPAALAPTAEATDIEPVNPALQNHGLAPGAQQALHQLQNHAQTMNHHLTLPPTTGPLPTSVHSHPHRNTYPQPQPQSQPQAPPQAITQQHPLSAAAAAAVAAAAPVHHQAHHPGVAGNADDARQASNRVFKLQFDAHKIVCCSQDPRIVIWDFANGDPDIQAATKFFVGP